MQLLSKNMSHFMCKDSVHFFTEYWKIFYKYMWKKFEKILIKVIQFIVCEDFHINIGKENSLAMFFDILYHTTIIYAYSALGFRLGRGNGGMWGSHRYPKRYMYP